MSEIRVMLVSCFVECRVCGWRLESRNAEGVAAQHAKKYGHRVETQVARLIVPRDYNAAEERVE